MDFVQLLWLPPSPQTCMLGPVIDLLCCRSSDRLQPPPKHELALLQGWMLITWPILWVPSYVQVNLYVQKLRLVWLSMMWNNQTPTHRFLKKTSAWLLHVRSTWTSPPPSISPAFLPFSLLSSLIPHPSSLLNSPSSAQLFIFSYYNSGSAVCLTSASPVLLCHCC